MKISNGSGTLIGRSLTIRGEISGSEDLYLDGEVHGIVNLTDGRLTVGPNARVLADIQVPDVVVFGRIEGNMKVHGRVELRQPATVIGDMEAARLSVEEGAAISGRIDLAGAGKAIQASLESGHPVETVSEHVEPLVEQ